MSQNVPPVVDRLSKFDKRKCPVGSPEVEDSNQESEQTVKNGVSPERLKLIIERLTNFDPHTGPPHSTVKRVPLGYGRYEYPGRTPMVAEMPKRKEAEVAEIIERLRREIVHSKNTPGSEDGGESGLERRTCSKEELQTIIEKFAECDFKKGPVGSTRERQMLGFNRYDYYHGPPHKVTMKVVTPDELQSILDRLTQYDINKGPPGSRGHEKVK